MGIFNETLENLNKTSDQLTEVLKWTRKSLSLLEKETWVNFFKKAWDWFKKLLWGDRIKEASSTTKANTIPTSTPTEAKIDYSKVDTSWFTPWDYPFKHIKNPYKWIQAYRVDNLKIHPLIWFSQLSLKWTEWPLTTLQVKEQKLHYNSTNTAWYKKNNPCNVSPFTWDVGRKWSWKVADWQNHGSYNSIEDWLASFMRLMRQNRYRNKSIQWINCSGMQWIYKENEPDSLKALRITRITHACNNLKISPFVRLNTDDKETMMAFTQQTAINESWAYFDRDTLERAYKKAFW